MTAWIKRVVGRCTHLYTRQIWGVAHDKEHRLAGRCYAVLRVLSITLTGLDEIKIFNRAAALSYSSLLGLIPLVAIGVLVGGTVLHNTDTAIVVGKINEAVRFVAPQIDHLERTAAAAGDPTQVGVNPKFVDLLNSFIAKSRSGTLGVAGALMLVVIVIQLFISVEEAFNSIWGVRRGRSLFLRIVMYWTLVTLGAVLAIAALSLLSAATIAALFENLPWGDELLAVLRWSGPLIAFVLLVGLLACFYRFLPNTNVLWGPAFAGAAVVVVLLFVNNYLAFFYLKTVLNSQSLFGSLALPVVMMGGLYVFWFIVLLGGQITYAVQNVRFRASRTAWNELNQHSREGLSLLVLVLVARRFKDCRPPFRASELSAAIRVPTQILNESLNRLLDLGLVTTTPPGRDESSLDCHYQPARPLARITFREFRDAFATLGASPSGERLDSVDPVLARFHERMALALRQALGDQTLEQWLDETPWDHPGPAAPPP